MPVMAVRFDSAVCQMKTSTIHQRIFPTGSLKTVILELTSITCRIQKMICGRQTSVMSTSRFGSNRWLLYIERFYRIKRGNAALDNCVTFYESQDFSISTSTIDQRLVALLARLAISDSKVSCHSRLAGSKATGQKTSLVSAVATLILQNNCRGHSLLSNCC